MAQRGVNKVILVGSAGQDPERRNFPDGGMITNLSIATSESWKDKQTGEQKERVEWHKLTFRGRLAEIVAEYVRKGSKIYVEGKLQTRKWQDQNGQDRYTTEIVASEMQMLDSRQDSQGAQQSTGQQQGMTQNAQGQQGFGSAMAAQAPHGQPAPNFSDFDDDIPFN